MKDLLIVLWVMVPFWVPITLLIALHDPTVKKDWARICIVAFVMACVFIPYAQINHEVRQMIERNVTND